MRYNVVDCGRRWGKTEYAKRKLAETARRGLPAAYLAPIYDQCFDVYTDLVDLLGPEIERRSEGKWIRLQNGGFIRFWSMENGADRVRGKKYARVVLDEVALVMGLKGIWEKVVRATLADYQGDAFFVSTPRRGSYFEQLFRKGQGEDPDWRSWQMTTHTNPFILPAEIVEMSKDMSEGTYAAEILAEFEVSESELVHPSFDLLRHVKSPTVGWADCSARIVGIDPGGGDPTAIVPLGIWKNTKPGAMNAGTNFHQYSEFYKRGNCTTEDIITYLGWLQQRGPITKVVVGETGGNLVTNSLLLAGFPAERFLGRKDAGIDKVNQLLETGRLQIDPSCVNSIAEFGQYRWGKRRDGETGERYATSTPVDNHADACDARRYAAVWALTQMEKPQVMTPVAMNWGSKRAG